MECERRRERINVGGQRRFHAPSVGQRSMSSCTVCIWSSGLDASPCSTHPGTGNAHAGLAVCLDQLWLVFILMYIPRPWAADTVSFLYLAVMRGDGSRLCGQHSAIPLLHRVRTHAHARCIWYLPTLDHVYYSFHAFQSLVLSSAPTHSPSLCGSKKEKRTYCIHLVGSEYMRVFMIVGSYVTKLQNGPPSLGIITLHPSFSGTPQAFYRTSDVYNT